MRERASSEERSSLFVEIGRAEWSALAPTIQSPLSQREIVGLRGLGDQLDMTEVEQVHLPLSRLLNLYATGARHVHENTASFLRAETSAPTPFVIGVAGSVAVGKSTVARLLRELLTRWDRTPRVELVTTDGFLLPNAELQRRGIMDRKGFPESYDRRALLRFVSRIKAGDAEVRAPYYSHLAYDIVPDAEVIVRRPDVLIVEGLNVLQPAPAGHALALADLFDFSIYVDARAEHIERWYVDRFLRLQRGAFTNPESYFHRYASLDEDAAVATAKDIWQRINGRNLVENIQPTRPRAKLVLRKAADHSVSSVLLRKI